MPFFLAKLRRRVTVDQEVSVTIEAQDPPAARQQAHSQVDDLDWQDTKTKTTLSPIVVEELVEGTERLPGEI